MKGALKVPDEVTPEIGNSTDEPVDWQKRYTDTQAEYTRQQQRIKELESAWDDEEAVAARIAEKFPHWLEQETEDDPEEYDDQELDQAAADPRIEQLLQWQQELDAERGQQRFENDLSETVGDRELSKQGHDWILFQTVQGGNNPAALDKAVKEWFEFEDGLKTPPETPERPKAPSPPQSGRAGEEQFDRKAASSTQRRAHRERKLAALMEAGQQQQT